MLETATWKILPVSFAAQKPMVTTSVYRNSKTHNHSSYPEVTRSSFWVWERQESPVYVESEALGNVVVAYCLGFLPATLSSAHSDRV